MVNVFSIHAALIRGTKLYFATASSLKESFIVQDIFLIPGPVKQSRFDGFVFFTR
jgi:hypothetical protein